MALVFSAEIIIRLLCCALIPVALSVAIYLLKEKTFFGKIPRWAEQLIIGVLFGGVAMLGTEFGVDVGGGIANARDAAPLCAGLLFGAPSGIIAGAIGGLWRWIAATRIAGMYSRVACSVSTALAGLYAAFLRKIVFDNKRPSPLLALTTGGVMEIIHLTILFLTHLTDSVQAFEIVKACTIPMVLCNGFAVFLATLLIGILSNGIHRKEKHYKNISKLFQTPLLIAIILAFVASTNFVFFLQSYSAEQNALQIIKLNIDDVKQEILDVSDRQIIMLTHGIADEITEKRTKGEEYSLKELAKKYGVTDIWCVDKNGIITEATDSNIGYDMASDKDLPEEERQSSRFLVLLDGETTEYVQEYRPLAADSSVKRKLAGVSMPDGFVQTGYDAECFQSEVSTQVYNLTKNRHIGENGHIIIIDENMNIVSDNADFDRNDIASMNIEITPDTPLDEKIKTNISGTDCMVMISESEGYYIVAVMTMDEVYETRDATAIVNSYMEILVFAALFIMVYIIIKRVVVDNLHKINSSLAKIIDGNLETTVDVKSSEEFASLTDDINSTVATLKRYIDEASSRIDRELAFAKSIQASSLPSVFPPYPGRTEFDIYASMDTAKEVGGDFYDFFLTDENHIAIVIADVSGKGIPAAMFMMRAKSIIKGLAETGIPVNEIMTEANSRLCEGNDADMFVTAWMGILDLNTGTMEFANAGHNPPVIYKKGQGYSYLKSKAGLVLAAIDGFSYTKQEISFAPGDKIYLYTDGVTEAQNSSEELFSEERLLTVLNGLAGSGCRETLEAVKAEVDSFKGEAEQFDDITMLMLSYKGKEASEDA